jgi:hypothetical protein
LRWRIRRGVRRSSRATGGAASCHSAARRDDTAASDRARRGAAIRGTAGNSATYRTAAGADAGDAAGHAAGNVARDAASDVAGNTASGAAGPAIAKAAAGATTAGAAVAAALGQGPIGRDFAAQRSSGVSRRSTLTHAAAVVLLSPGRTVARSEASTLAKTSGQGHHGQTTKYPQGRRTIGSH